MNRRTRRTRNVRALLRVDLPLLISASLPLLLLLLLLVILMLLKNTSYSSNDLVDMIVNVMRIEAMKLLLVLKKVLYISTKIVVITIANRVTNDLSLAIIKWQFEDKSSITIVLNPSPLLATIGLMNDMNSPMKIAVNFTLLRDVVFEKYSRVNCCSSPSDSS